MKGFLIKKKTISNPYDFFLLIKLNKKKIFSSFFFFVFKKFFQKNQINKIRFFNNKRVLIITKKIFLKETKEKNKNLIKIDQFFSQPIEFWEKFALEKLNKKLKIKAGEKNFLPFKSIRNFSFRNNFIFFFKSFKKKKK
ncbi:hypothetical protein HAN_3g473 (nucleomorph) [Hemiselmis andersenii]|uniref:Uncharacterized protein n=1 Tax=Hemiselmis andersenii TaxID=464988 RepID=A9BL92_HEMAN|nr:hypothetical protein HAN_3g473 [Hemiselmis andersenii]ABW98275.1 hypothetical protein HAN_3g473 [Hemiselmis andersenii]